MAGIWESISLVQIVETGLDGHGLGYPSSWSLQQINQKMFRSRIYGSFFDIIGFIPLASRVSYVWITFETETYCCLNYVIRIYSMWSESLHFEFAWTISYQLLGKKRNQVSIKFQLPCSFCLGQHIVRAYCLVTFNVSYIKLLLTYSNR